MPTTPNMNLVLPTDHGSVEVWDTVLDAVFALIDSHQHTTGQGVPIQSSALRINADVSTSFSGVSYAFTDVKAIDFAAVAATAVSGYAGALWINSADNELYYRTVAGVNVKFTNGAALNFAAFVGGIGGDYSAVGALESYDDATRRYLFQQEGGPQPWAGLAAGNIDIYQQAASIVNKVQLKSPNALAASYALTFPAAVPAAAQMLTVDAAGQLALDGVLGNNVNLKFQGTGHVLRGARTITMPLHKFTDSINIAGGGATTPSGGTIGVANPASGTNLFPCHPGTVDARLMSITSVNVWAAVAGGNATFTLMQTTSAGNVTPIAGASTITASSVQYSAVTLTPTAPFSCATDLLPGGSLWLQVACAAGVTQCNIASVDFITTVPT